MSLLTSVLVYSLPSNRTMPSRTYKRKGASFFNTMRKRLKGFTGLKDLAARKKPMKLNSKQLKDAEDLAKAVKSKEPHALELYFKRFDDAQIQGLCEAVQLPPSASREENVRKLIRKIKSKRKNISFASQIGFNRFLTIVFTAATAWLTASVVSGGYSMYKLNRQSKPENRDLECAQTVAGVGIVHAPLGVLLSSICYSHGKTLRKRYRQWKTEKTHEDVDALQGAIRTYKRPSR